MNDRRRLLALSTLILGLVALGGLGVAVFHVHAALGRSPALRHANGRELFDAVDTAAWLSLAINLVLVIGGGTLLVRAINPFMRRLEQSEARLRAIFDTAGDAILIVDDRGIIESANRAAERIFGWPCHELAGRPLDLLLESAADSPANHSWSAAALRSLGSNSHGRGRRRRGDHFPLEVSISELDWGSGSMFTAIVRDITQRRAAEEQMHEHLVMLEDVRERLETKATELARINRELDEFTYIASHDLKEPLRGISSYCQILLEDYSQRLDDDGRRKLEALVSLCERLSRLIDDLLTYSKIGRIAPAGAPADLNAVVADVLETLGPSIDGRGAAVRIVDTLPRLPADRTLMGEVFRNLIGNGLKFNDSPSPRIEIGCLDQEPPVFYVRDNGIGIAPEHHGEIFTMFRRLHSRRKYDGTGAGLTFVRRIVEGHGGSVWVESEPGCGATFYFTLTPGATCGQPELATSAAG